MNKVEAYLKKQMPQDLESYASSGKIIAFSKGKKCVETSWGKDYSFYDIASLTKIVFANSIFMQLVEQKQISTQDSVSKHVPWFAYPKVKVANLLSHTSGMQWWKPYYKYISTDIPKEWRWFELQTLLAQERPQPFKKAVYSDLDYFFLGFILQNILNRSLSEIWNNFQTLDFHFNEDHKLQNKKSLYAPTEKCLWRKKILHGEVHDENAWALGGISTHAGLFGSIESLAKYGAFLRNKFYDHPSSLRGFFHKVTQKGEWTLGFMQPSPQGSSSGKYFSPQSIGHTGFTGTSLWFDPKRDLIVCILSNRVHPSRKNRKFVELRPRIHDWIVEGVENV